MIQLISDPVDLPYDDDVEILETSTSFILWSEERAINLSHYEELDIQILPI